VIKQAEFRPFGLNQVSLSSLLSLESAYNEHLLFLDSQTYSPTRLVSDSLFRTPSKPPKQPYLGPSAPKARQSDPFHILSVNPLNEAINPDLVSSYLTQMGKIKTRAETGLTWKNQRRIGKMVRRARAMGLVSRWSDQVHQPATKEG
jgi:small subunit ribosomal protein S18